MCKDEWDFWTSEDNLVQLEMEDRLPFVQARLSSIQDQFDFISIEIDQEIEILPGIHAVAAPGHTPGHMALVISSVGEQLFCISDLVLHPIHLERPEWCAVVDLAPDQVVTTRRRILNRAAAEKALALAFHFPFPGLGHILQKEDGWEWQPIEKMV